MTIRKHFARILRKAARKLDPPPTPRKMAREMTESTVKALAAMQANEFSLDRWLPNLSPSADLRLRRLSDTTVHGPEGVLGGSRAIRDAYVKAMADKNLWESRARDLGWKDK